MNWQQFQRDRKLRKSPLLIAHRGASAICPENTMLSFTTALDHGANAIETDLRFTRDDEIVIVHDETIDRTTNGVGFVKDFSLAEIQGFSIKTDNGELTDERIPSFRDFLAQVKSDTPLLLELKDPLFKQEEFARSFVKTLDEYGALERTAVVSFDIDHVRAIKKEYSEIPIGQICLWNPFPRRSCELQGPYWRLLLLNPFYVYWAHRLGSVVCALDLQSEERMEFYINRKVDAVLVNNPALALQAMEKLRCS